MKKDTPVEKKKGNIHYYIFLSVAAVVAAVYFVAVETILFDAVFNSDASLEKSVAAVVVNEVAEPVVKEPEAPAAAGTADVLPSVEQKEEPYAFVMVEELDRLDLGGITVDDTDLYTVKGELCRHKVESNETLTRIALKYYGSKKLWPYLVMHNKLARPDDLRCGMEISIPMLVPSK
jgi:nucleoid-associated protein YgaU